MRPCFLITTMVILLSGCKKDSSTQDDLTSTTSITLVNNGKEYGIPANIIFTRSGIYTTAFFYATNSEIAVRFDVRSETAPSFVGTYRIEGDGCQVTEYFQGGLVFLGDYNNRNIGELIVTESTSTYRKGIFTFTAKSPSNSGNQVRTFSGSFIQYL